ncbi:hypothetical protein BAZMOX_63318_1 [methanotrophic endosymbiont of Bathymodiolus azoricus (Menez Gwen)]|nr:hypothetical protein BAZMOX_63318_1 [methanotrophic endosymbiont of Bathymodiolus azoricus (Menez Gwen)]
MYDNRIIHYFTEISQFLFKETLDNANIFRKLALSNVSF